MSGATDELFESEYPGSEYYIVVMAVVMNRVEVTLMMRAVVITPVMRVSRVSVEESECEVVN